MANIKSGNSHYVDTEGVLTDGPCKLLMVVMTATDSGASAVLSDKDGITPKLALGVATDGETRVFDFTDAPITFPNGISVATLTNSILTVMYN